MSNQQSLNIANTLYSHAQNSVWTGYIASLPVSYIVMNRLATNIKLERGGASQYTIPAPDLLDIKRSIVGLSKGSIEERFTVPTQTNVVLETSEHGISVLVFSNLTLQTPLNVSAMTSRLVANGAARLRETLAINHLNACGAANVYMCRNGTNTFVPTEKTVTDLIQAKSLLDMSRTQMFNQNMLMATDQYGTSPLGHTYCMLMSMASASDLAITLANQPNGGLLLPERHAGIKNYNDSFRYSIPAANLSCFVSSEMQVEAPSSGTLIFNDYIIGKDAIFLSSGPATSGISIRDSSLFPYKRTSCIDYYMMFAFGCLSTRIVSVKSTQATRK